MLLGFHIFLSFTKDPIHAVLPYLATLSLSAPSGLTTLQRYVQCDVILISFAFSCILGGLFFVFRDITSVFFMVMFRPIWLAFLCKFHGFFFAFAFPNEIVKPGHLHNLSLLGC